MACETHVPLFWESEPLPTFAHTPLPKSNSAMLSPSICFIFELPPCRTHKSPTPEGFLARGTISELMVISIAERDRQRGRAGQNARISQNIIGISAKEKISWFPHVREGWRGPFRVESGSGPV